MRSKNAEREWTCIGQHVQIVLGVAYVMCLKLLHS